MWPRFIGEQSVIERFSPRKEYLCHPLMSSSARNERAQASESGIRAEEENISRRRLPAVSRITYVTSGHITGGFRCRNLASETAIVSMDGAICTNERTLSRINVQDRFSDAIGNNVFDPPYVYNLREAPQKRFAKESRCNFRVCWRYVSPWEEARSRAFVL